MLYQSEAGLLRLALVGDVMLTRRLSVFSEQRYLLLRTLLREADAVFANLESSAREYEEGTAGTTEGTYMTTEPALLDDLKWLGVGLVSCANNHAFNYGESGVIASLRHLDDARIVHAGAGRNLREARSPGYLDTPAGRVALIAATSTFGEWERAGEQRPDSAGRPGLNALGVKTLYEVDGPTFDALRRIGQQIGDEAEKTRKRNFGFFAQSEIGGSGDREFTFLGKNFVRADGFAIRTVPNAGDLEGNLAQIREARRQADWVVVSLHCHDLGGADLLTAEVRSQLTEPADLFRTFAHACIDAGADVIAGHGPHFMLGMEVYRRRPIFYSLGDFIFQNETVRVFPAQAYERFHLGHDATPADFLDVRSEGDTKAHPGDRAYWESVVPVCSFRSGSLTGVEVYPVDLGYGRPRAQRGRPVLASGDVAERIVSRFAELSGRLGTAVTQEDGRGLVSVT